MSTAGTVFLADTSLPRVAPSWLLSGILIHHSDCGMLTFTDDEFKAQIEADTGLRPGWAPESLRDPAADVKQSLARIAANPFIPQKDHVRGFVYSVTDGSLTEIT